MQRGKRTEFAISRDLTMRIKKLVNTKARENQITMLTNTLTKERGNFNRNINDLPRNDNVLSEDDY